MIHPECLDYCGPSPEAIADMQRVREAGKVYMRELIASLPDGSDKTYALRKLREVAMWANVSLTRHQDGSPRT